MVIAYDDDGYLKKLYMKNELNDFVFVKATKPWDNRSFNILENLLNWDCDNINRYFSSSVNEPFILFEFKHSKPAFNMYSFETHVDGSISHPLKWIVQGSNNENGNWEMLDSRDVTILNSYSKKANFTMKTNRYKFIKFTQLKNIYNYDYINTFALKRIDFYLDQTSCIITHSCYFNEYISLLVYCIITLK